VTGMDRLGCSAAGGVEDRLLVQVTLERVGLVGVGDVRGAPVRVGVDRDRPDPELAQGTEDADSDLAAVRHEDFAENRHCPTILQTVSLPDALTVARAASVP